MFSYSKRNHQAKAANERGNCMHRTTPILIKIMLFLVPVYGIFYHPLYDHPEKAERRSLWKWVLAGFGLYAVVIAIKFAL